MNTSRVKLDINIDQDSRALDDYKALLSSLTGNGKDAIKISITGTVGNPRVNFPMGEAGFQIQRTSSIPALRGKGPQPHYEN
jgi:hypothetical protein